MGHVDDAGRILHGTEQSLRALIETALAEHNYVEVAAIAKIVDGVAGLRRHALETRAAINGSGEASTAPEAEPPTTTGMKPRARRPRRAVQTDEFPRFERDGDKLVKLGWSKRDERIYEHRAPRDIVFLVATAIASKVRPKAVFAMDQVMPISDEGGHEVPSYQAYMALAWLRSLGIVTRKGREGYTLTSNTLDGQALRRLWTAVPEKR
jgi:hypothetical protein